MLQTIIKMKARRMNWNPKADPGRAGSALTDIQALALRARMAVA